MTSGVLGLIICPMFDDNLVYSLEHDTEDRAITLVTNGHENSLSRKLDKRGIGYERISWNDVVCRRYRPDTDRFNILAYSIDLALHSKPEFLKSTVEDLARDMQPYVDAIGFYLGTCGNYAWDIPKWCEANGLKPSAMFRDPNGVPCDDCVGVAIGGGPRYLELQKKYTGHFYLFPAMANNYEDFMMADQADSAAAIESLDDEARETLGIEPGRDGYIRWLFRLGGYEYILKLDTGIGEREVLEADMASVAERTQLKLRDPEDGWVTLQPTDDLYRECKAMLSKA